MWTDEDMKLAYRGGYVCASLDERPESEQWLNEYKEYTIMKKHTQNADTEENPKPGEWDSTRIHTGKANTGGI